MSERRCLSIILAAGGGKRMNSALPKVLHKIAGLPMICHVVRTVCACSPQSLAIVASPGNVKALSSEIALFAPNAEFFVQDYPKGTADAVLSARKAFDNFDDLLVLYADTPLISASVLFAARESLARGNCVVVAGFFPEDPSGYGRILKKNGSIHAIREDRDCSEEEKKTGFCNAGFMGISAKMARELLEGVGQKGRTKELYLTDIVELASQKAWPVDCLIADAQSASGVNTRNDLAKAENSWQQSKRLEIMREGVTLVAPETVFFAYDTVIGKDSIIEPYVFFGPHVTLDGSVRVCSFSCLEGASIASGSQIGPFVRLRPGTQLEKNVRIGNFVEIKKALVQDGARVNHLSYIGDARLGARTNVGAGCVTCNYDGYSKFFTDIGDDTFIGSNASLVAPVSIAQGAYVASGSVVTENVPQDALVFGRSRQTNLEGRAIQLRKKKKSGEKDIV